MSGLFYCHGCKRDLDTKLKHPTKKVNNNHCCINCSNKTNSFNRLSNAAQTRIQLEIEARKIDADAITRKNADKVDDKLLARKQRLDKLSLDLEINKINKESFELDYDLSS